MKDFTLLNNRFVFIFITHSLLLYMCDFACVIFFFFFFFLVLVLYITA